MPTRLSTTRHTTTLSPDQQIDEGQAASTEALAIHARQAEKVCHAEGQRANSLWSLSKPIYYPRHLQGEIRIDLGSRRGTMHGDEVDARTTPIPVRSGRRRILQACPPLMTLPPQTKKRSATNRGARSHSRRRMECTTSNTSETTQRKRKQRTAKAGRCEVVEEGHPSDPMVRASSV